MRKFYFILPVLLLAILLVRFQTSERAASTSKKYSKGERIEGYYEDLKFTSSDVDLGIIPYEKYLLAVEEGERRLRQADQNRSLDGSLSDATWRERGPSNVGGRTRAILIDAGDPARDRIWVGSVSGGLWRTEDITQQEPQWTKIGLQLDNIAIGSIAQDPNNHQVFYVGTGEGYNNADAVSGVGLFKSTDDGASWTSLVSTRTSNFQNVHEVFVHTNGDVYAGTEVGGLFRSKDGGGSWEKVLGTSLSGASSNNMYDFHFNPTNQTFYASNANSVFKSATGDRGSWTDIGVTKPGFPNDMDRVELAVCPSDPNVMYVIGAVNGDGSNTYVSNTGGNSWTMRPRPGDPAEDNFTNGQAWYDLDIAVDPFNCGRILAGGVPMFESNFQGISWERIEGNMHVDQHNITFDPQIQGRVLFGNDGGIWLSNNGGATIAAKSRGYVTSQFYAAAIHPEAGSHYLLGGTQDNGTRRLTEPGLSISTSAYGADGAFCFIDQNEPHIQILSWQNGNYLLSLDDGENFEVGPDVEGEFINRSGYDDVANILYGQLNQGGYFRWKIDSSITEEVRVAGQSLELSAVKADPHTPNRIYFGGAGGRVLRIDNAHQGLSVQGTLIADLPGNASVSSIYMDRQTPDDILVSMYNYGVNLDNIWVTYDAGAEWISIEGDLPDMPVRWAVFDPSDHDRVMIATEAGIWTTDDVNGEFTHWSPPNPENGMPFVRVDMLQMRESDKVVLAATHGRGLFTTEVFSAPAAVILTRPVAYENQAIVFDGSHSVNAQSFHWDFGDFTTSDQETVTHTYALPGTYTITLTINGTVTTTRTLTILPYLPAPYEPGVAQYAGDFENLPQHFAAYTVQGTGFQRGVSSKPGKDGTHSGAFAWVLGINDNVYQNNTRAELYTPQYDLTEPGLYELKFWTKFAIQNLKDGFQIEYSTDSGASWQQLGSKDDPGWYNYLNVNISDGAFPEGKSYFTNVQLNWKQYVKDISFLSGQSHVSFRYVFRSDAVEQAQGLAIDDFEITKFDGELKTTITNFHAEYTGEQEITIQWTTGIEYHADEFILERSFTGFAFEEIAHVTAKGGITTVDQSYEWKDQSLRSVIFYRLRSINDNADLNYHYEFYSDVIVVRRDVDAGLVHYVLTNPFRDRIFISFSSLIDQEVSLRLYDMAGRLVRDEKQTPNSVGIELDRLGFPPGIYILSIQIGDGEPSTYKLFTEGR